MGVGSWGGEMSVVVVASFSGRGGAEMLVLRGDFGGMFGGLVSCLLSVAVEGKDCSDICGAWFRGIVGYE